MCWQSAGCDGIGPTQTSPAFYWLQLHMRRCDILTEFRVCCSSVRMKQLQFLFSNNRGPEVFWGIMTLIIICHQNDNDHHHHWDETLRTVPVASESIRFYMSTYSAHYTLMAIFTSTYFTVIILPFKYLCLFDEIKWISICPHLHTGYLVHGLLSWGATQGQNAGQLVNVWKYLKMYPKIF